MGLRSRSISVAEFDGASLFGTRGSFRGVGQLMPFKLTTLHCAQVRALKLVIHRRSRLHANGRDLYIHCKTRNATLDPDYLIVVDTGTR